MGEKIRKPYKEVGNFSRLSWKGFWYHLFKLSYNSFSSAQGFWPTLSVNTWKWFTFPVKYSYMHVHIILASIFQRDSEVPMYLVIASGVTTIITIKILTQLHYSLCRVTVHRFIFQKLPINSFIRLIFEAADLIYKGNSLILSIYIYWQH